MQDVIDSAILTKRRAVFRDIVCSFFYWQKRADFRFALVEAIARQHEEDDDDDWQEGRRG